MKIEFVGDKDQGSQVHDAATRDERYRRILDYLRGQGYRATPTLTQLPGGFTNRGQLCIETEELPNRLQIKQVLEMHEYIAKVDYPPANRKDVDLIATIEVPDRPQRRRR